MKTIEPFQSSEFLWNIVKDCCEDIITIKDINLNYIACNKAFLNLLDLNETDVINKKFFDILSIENAKETEKNLKILFETQKPVSFVLILDKEVAERKIVRQTATLVKENGKIIGILSVSRDVTKEEELKTKLIEANSKFNTLLEHIPMIVYMKDNQGNFITSSQYAKKFLKLGQDPYIDNLPIELTETKEDMHKEDCHVMKINKSIVTEKTSVDAKGIMHWYRIVKAPIHTKNNVNGIVTIVQNIDVEKEDKKQQEMFLAELTHDMKNSILAQLSCLELMFKGTWGQLNNEQKNIMEVIIESTKYMKDLLYSILKAYKYDNGALKLEYKEFNIEKLINSCITEVLALAQEKNIKITYNSTLKENEKILTADKRHLRVVIANMINNGLSYGFNDSEYIINTNCNKDKMVFSFENMSPEIPEHIKNHIFDKYVTGASQYKKIGFGLGLYISKKVIEEHKGILYLETNGNKNKFILELPLKPLI